MKKIFCAFLLTVIMVLAVGCSSDQPTKASGAILNVLPQSLRNEVAAANPDVVSLDYFGNHAEDYKKNTYYDLIIIKGKVTHFGINNTGSYLVNLDNSKYSLIIYDDNSNFVEGKEYIFITNDLPSLFGDEILINTPYYFCLSDEV